MNLILFRFKKDAIKKILDASYVYVYQKN